MEIKKYIIKYRIILENNESIIDKEIKINNCLSELQAKIKLEDYLKRHYSNFKSLIVEEICKDYSDLFNSNSFNNLWGDFGNLFNPKK